MSAPRIVWSLLLSGAVATAACGDSKSLNPVGPSAVVVQGPHSDSVSGAKGGVPGPPDGKGKDNNGGDNGNGNGNGNGQNPQTPEAPGLKKVEIEGLISAKGNDSIVVNGQQIVVPSACPIRHGQTRFTFADLHLNDRVHVRANRTAVLEATEVILQNPGDGEGSGADAPTTLVSVTATDGTASESPVDTGTFTLTRSGSAASLVLPLTVNYTVTGTATSASDYAALSGTATFLASQATTTVVVTPLADGTTEDAESVILALTSGAAYDLGSPFSASVMIAAEPPVVSVTATDGSASETPVDTGTFTLTRVAGASSLASPLTVNYTVSGTATSGSDYTALSGTATFLAGQATTSVVVTPLADAATEDAESVILTLASSASYELGSPASASVVIAAEPTLVSVTATDGSASETPVDTGTFTLTRAGSASSMALPLTVNYTVSGTATAGDYSPLSGTATFLAGQATTTVVVTPLADATIEDAESVMLTLASSVSYDLGSPASATVMIAAEPTLVSVTATDGSASETAGDTGTFTLTRAGSATSMALPLTVNYTVTGTATSPDDYAPLSGTVTFLAGQAATTVVVTPVADATTEVAESVMLTLASSASYDLGSPASATVMIAADPIPLAPPVSVPVVTVVAIDALAFESTVDPGRFRLSRTGSTASSLTVTFTLTGTATNGADYQAVPLSVTFAAGSATVEVWVRPLRDSDNAEVAETVILTLTDGAAYDVGTSASATVKISP